MSLKQEYKKWLYRSHKSFEENLEFAIKSLKSSEFAITSKYGISLKWFCDEIIINYKKNDIESLDLQLIEEFLNFNFPSGLVSIETKQEIVNTWLKIAELVIIKEKDSETIQNVNKIIFLLLQHGSYQDLYKCSYEMYSKLLRTLLKNYEFYINSIKQNTSHDESNFFTATIANLKDFIKNLSKNNEFKDYFIQTILQPLLEIYIVLKANNLKYFNEVFELITSVLLSSGPTKISFETCLNCSLHIYLQYMEFEIVHYRGHLTYFPKLLYFIFTNLQEKYQNIVTRLEIISHILDLLQKHDISLNFDVIVPDNNDKKSFKALLFISEHIQQIVDNYYQQNLTSVLKVLCSTIKLNPMILEKNIFQILTKCMLARKSDNAYKRYEEFLMLTIEMFKKLSRSEKLVSHLLKSIKEYLKTNKLSKKLKRKLKTGTNDDDDDDDGDEMSFSEKKIKLDLDMSLNLSFKNELNENINNNYLKMLRNEFNVPFINLEKNRIVKLNYDWRSISFAWPAKTVGIEFSKFISTLMSKPSLIIWKTLLFSLLEIIDDFQNNPSTIIDENLLFNIDFHSILLCEYLIGSRLSEQSDKFWNEINQNHKQTYNLLQKFGQTLLNFEHNNRLMNAFLEISSSIGDFDLISWYYCPDSIQTLENENSMKFVKNVQSYLTKDEWILIEQRIKNFGNAECKIQIDYLYLQKLKSRLLFNNQIVSLTTEKVNIKNFLLSSTLTNVEQLKTIFSDSLSNIWLLDHMSREDKLQACETIFTDSNECLKLEFLSQFIENHEFFKIIVINLYKSLASCFTSKKSILSTINFDQLLTLNDIKAYEINLQEIIQKICEKDEIYSIKNYSFEELEKLLQILIALPVSFCQLTTKTLIFILHLSLYRDLMATNDQILTSFCFNLFTDLLHFGEPIRIFDYLSIENLLKIFQPSTSMKFYEFLFHTFKKIPDNAEKCLTKLIGIFSQINFNDIRTNYYLELAVLLIESISHQISVKKFKKYQDEMISIFIVHVNKYFENHGNKINKSKEDRKNEEINDKEFVVKTLPAYTVYIYSLLSKTKSDQDIDENVKRICKIYIGYSMDCNNSNAIRLINTALKYKIRLHFDPDEIEFVLKEYWKQLEKSIIHDNNSISQTNIETVIKLIVNHYSPEDFQKSLSKISGKNKIEYVCQILSQISKCQLDSVKRTIFSEYFNQIIHDCIELLPRNSNNCGFKIYTDVIQILNCQQTYCENNKIPLSRDHLDNILSFLMEINIKKFRIHNKNDERVFNSLHSCISAICLALIKFRHTLLSDRIPQFTYIFKGLLQALCWYKSDRRKDISLENDELNNLEELALKLENLSHIMLVHNVDVKRVAPYLLIFTINLMITNNQSTTLYSKIKSRIESICYDLISICDNRVGSFILRCMNDAGKQIYEALRKDHQKYKFKGKV